MLRGFGAQPNAAVGFHEAEDQADASLVGTAWPIKKIVDREDMVWHNDHLFVGGHQLLLTSHAY